MRCDHGTENIEVARFMLNAHGVEGSHVLTGLSVHNQRIERVWVDVVRYIVTPQCRSKGNISGGARERRRCEPLEVSGGMLPQKILKSRGLEMPFPAFSKSYL